MKKYNKNILINKILIIIVILGFLYMSIKYNISSQDLENQVFLILKEKMISHEILYKDESLTGDEAVEIINSKQTGNIKVFTGKIITDDQPVIFMITFKKHLIFNTYKFDEVIASTQYGDYMVIYTSHGFIKYINKLNYDNFDISIERNPKYSKIIPFVIIPSIYIIQRMKMKKQNNNMNKKENEF